MLQVPGAAAACLFYHVHDLFFSCGLDYGDHYSCREAPLLDYEKGSSRLFHPEGLDRFDYLVAKLKEKGIYLHMGADQGEEMWPYKDEVQRRFGDYLLMKYHTRERLKQAWTLDGVCALGDEEDPAQGTVRGIEGGFYQSVNEPLGPWGAPENPARYADFMEFGTLMNRRFYQDMKDYLVSLGVKVPIVASNLMAGAADVYGHTDGDLMENNTYFNHPILPVQNDTYMVYGPTEYVSTNPLTMQQGIGAMGTSLLSLASVAIVEGKPFMLSEWNEYGLHPFHSTAFVHTVAYACLNDWDGLVPLPGCHAAVLGQ